MGSDTRYGDLVDITVEMPTGLIREGTLRYWRFRFDREDDDRLVLAGRKAQLYEEWEPVLVEDVSYDVNHHARSMYGEAVRRLDRNPEIVPTLLSYEYAEGEGGW